MGKIRDYNRATKTHHKNLHNEIEEVDIQIKDKLNDELKLSSQIDNKRMRLYLSLHKKYGGEESFIDFLEIDNNALDHKIDIHQLIDLVKKDDVVDLFFILNDLSQKPKNEDYHNFFNFITFLLKLENLEFFNSKNLNQFKLLKSGFSKKLEKYLQEFREMKGVLGYLLRRTGSCIR